MPRGNKCGCICPSCKTPLIARQGDLKEWHFAHQSKNTQSETTTACDYSFAVSVRLMIHQLATRKLKYLVPDYKIVVESWSDRSYKSKRIELTVAKKSLITIEKVKVDERFCGVSVDILGDVRGIPFAIYITHRNRKVPPNINPPDISKCGVVGINIDFLHSLFRSEKEGRYIDVLQKYIEEDIEGKQWIYHPRTLAVKKQAENNLQQWLSTQEALPSEKRPRLDRNLPLSESGKRKGKQVSHKPKIQSFRCVMCNATWKGISPQCQNCGTHLFSTITGTQS